MKRIWFGAALLAALLILGIFSAALMEDTHLTQATQLNRAADFAMSGNWNGAKAAFSEAQTSWDKRSPVIAGLSDHEPMDEAEMLFAQLEAFAKAKEAALYSSTCLQLARQIEALGQSHRLNLQNLL
jgi:hypothetical protein